MSARRSLAELVLVFVAALCLGILFTVVAYCFVISTLAVK